MSGALLEAFFELVLQVVVDFVGESIHAWLPGITTPGAQAAFACALAAASALMTAVHFRHGHDPACSGSPVLFSLLLACAGLAWSANLLWRSESRTLGAALALPGSLLALALPFALAAYAIV